MIPVARADSATSRAAWPWASGYAKPFPFCMASPISWKSPEVPGGGAERHCRAGGGAGPGLEPGSAPVTGQDASPREGVWSLFPELAVPQSGCPCGRAPVGVGATLRSSRCRAFADAPPPAPVASIPEWSALPARLQFPDPGLGCIGAGIEVLVSDDVLPSLRVVPAHLSVVPPDDQVEHSAVPLRIPSSTVSMGTGSYRPSASRSSVRRVPWNSSRPACRCSARLSPGRSPVASPAPR